MSAAVKTRKTAARKPQLKVIQSEVVYYRTRRGGHVPLSEQAKSELLELYIDHDRPMKEIAALFGRAESTIYRWLDRLGVQPLP